MSTLRIAIYLRGPSDTTTNLREVKSARLVRWTQVTDLAFKGMRFLHHSVLLEVGQELATFQRLVTEVAGDLWRSENPERERLPAHFDEMTKLRFVRVADGSTVLPLEAPVESDADSLFGERPSPHLEYALQLIVDAMRSQEQRNELPPKFPRQRIGRVIELGETLQDDESLTVGNGRIKKTGTLNKATRQRFRHYLTSYYDDVVKLYGDLRAVDMDGPVAEVKLPDHTRIPVAFTKDQGATFKRFLDQPVALEGVAEISKIDGFIRRIRSVTDVSPIEPLEGEDALLSWLQDPAVIEAWSILPSDASINLDKYLYGEQTDKKE